MFEVPVLRFGKPYDSMEKVDIKHFETGETLARLHQATGAMVKMDLRKAQQSREALRQFSIDQLIEICKRAADLYLNAELPCGTGSLTPDQFCQMQSATTGIPISLCAFNMRKNSYVLSHMGEVIDALTRGLPHEILSKGYGMESRGVMVSYQATTPILGAVLPSNSPGVHTLWLPAIPMQVGLMLKPGSQEFWTPYRITEAFYAAGIPREAISLYPGGHDVGGGLLSDAQRCMIFGSQQTVQQHAGNPKVSVHGPGFSKIILGDDLVDQWEDYLDVMVDSVAANGGRGCINCSSIYASRNTLAIAEAIAKKMSELVPLPANDPKAILAASTTAGVAESVSNQIDEGLKAGGATDVSAKYHGGSRIGKLGQSEYLLPTVIHCTSPEAKLANAEYMFPFTSVVECPQNQMIKSIGPTLVCTAITEDPKFSQQLLDAYNIDRLNIGRVKTVQLNWLQPHEGNLVEFLFRNRAFQNSPPPAH